MNPRDGDNYPGQIRLEFIHEGKSYIITTGDMSWTPWWDEYWGEWSHFWLEEGNGGCDCNRSSLIREHFPDFPELLCGDKIELADYDLIPVENV